MQSFAWEYKVMHLNIEITDSKANQSSSPEEASKKLKGTLSPSFIQSQFPDEYKEKEPDLPIHGQIQQILNVMGKENWELINISTIGVRLLFFFKRPVYPDDASS